MSTKTKRRFDVIDYASEAEYPREFFANLEFRNNILEYCSKSEQNRRAIWIKCARDPLFYINTFVYTFDPRLEPNVIPFITYAFQDHAVHRIIKAIDEGRDLAIEKSRDMGVSWVVLAVLEWYWKFRNRQSFLLLSRKEELVDKTDSMDALMPKIDFIHEYQPRWMNDPHRLNLHLANIENKSVIDGESTNGDAGRGGRRKAIAIDEAAAVQNGFEVNAATSQTTNCRIWISTPKGKGNEFYDIITEKRCEILTFHWTMHPEKAKGLYIDEFGNPRSPWYDEQVAKLSPKIIAQEIDIDYDASDSKFFSGERDAELSKLCREPYLQGEMAYDRTLLDNVEFKPTEKGRLKLWCYLGMDGKPAWDRQYVIGSDISTGSGASDTVHSVIDVKEMVKVAEWQSNTDSPSEAAKEGIALARFFNNAYMIWEANGPGAVYGRIIDEKEYYNIYYFRDERTDGSVATQRAGWYSTKDGKRELLTRYQNAIECDPAILINYSKDSIDQLSFYIYGPNGSVVHSRSEASKEHESRGLNHGDNVIADALALKGVIELEGKVPDNVEEEETEYTPKVVEKNTLAYRHQQYRKETEEAGRW